MSTTTHRAYNFNAGPAALPLAVLQKAQEEFTNFQNAGMSVMEMSHRSAIYEQVNNETEQLLLELLGVKEGYQVLFVQGGASTQFAMVPLNFLRPGKVADYVMTGAWAEKAIQEARLFGDVAIAADMASDQYMRMPSPAEIKISEHAAYVHITSNETISGAQFKQFPDTGNVPLIADMSSDILSKPIDVTKFGLIYAGAQKNLGPSGVTVVIIREDLLADLPKNIPTMLRYGIHSKNKSLYNTPPSFSVYMVNLVLKWLKEQGGLESVNRRNEEKAKLIYDAIDNSGGFYLGAAQKESRSLMNITFRLQTEELEKAFAKASEQAGFVGLKGHRSVGGLRASTYNAVPYEACAALQQFMLDFQQKNG
jgi:phosphoserine aminotransferase